MTSQNLILSISISALLAFGCGGTATEAQEPAQPDSQADGDMASDDDMAAAGDSAGEATGDSAGGADALSATEPGPQISPTGDVRFNFQPTGRTKKIYLAGNFNGWDPSNDDYLLADEDGDGIYSITIQLEPGVYQYKFVIDGRWTKDPHAPGSHPDGYGGQNGKFEVQ